MKYYLGIDPGLSGALAFFDPKNDDLRVYDMPTHEVNVNGKNKRTIDMHSLMETVSNNARGGRVNIIKAIIEKVHAMPKQGVVSSFNFGFNVGCTQMAVVANKIALVMVPPASWKKSMKITADKSEARRQASLLMPNHAHNWPLKKHDGRAEAALLAYYLWEKEPMAKNQTMEDML